MEKNKFYFASKENSLLDDLYRYQIDLPKIVVSGKQGNKTTFVKVSIAPKEYPNATPPTPTISPITKPSSMEMIITPRLPHQNSDLGIRALKSNHLVK